MSHVLQLDIAGNPNIGLMIFATDNYCLVGNEVPDNSIQEIEKTLQVPVHVISIAGTSLVGAFVAGNNNGIIIPSIAFEHEKEQLTKLSIPFTTIDTKHTALGNNIAINEEGICINPEFEDQAKEQIQKAFGLPLQETTIVDQNTVGSCLVLTKKGGVIHRDAPDQTIEALSKLFKTDIEIGTVNQGVVQVASGLVANNKGFVIGSHTTGIEITNIDEILGYLE